MVRALGLLLITAASAAVAQNQNVGFDTSKQTFKPEVAVVAAVTSRDKSGRVQRFSDARKRVYSVAYDDAKLVKSIRKRADRVYVDDLLDIAYADDGRLVQVVFGDGSAYYFSYGENGIQHVQDRMGNLVTRELGRDGRARNLKTDDASGGMAGNLVKLDALLTSLKKPQ